MNIVFFDLETQKLFQEVGGRDASSCGSLAALPGP